MTGKDRASESILPDVLSLSGIVLVVGLVAGLARGGKLSNIANAEFRSAWLVFVGLGIQLVAELAAAFWSPSLRSGGKGLAILLVSYAFIIAFMVQNRGLPGALLVGAGLAANLIVIAVNGGMPVSVRAANIAGIPDIESYLGIAIKHRPMTASTPLAFLGDWIPLPYLRKVISIGDILLAMGVFVLIDRLVRYEPKRLATSDASSKPDPAA